MPHTQPQYPLIAGGQGRSDADLSGDAESLAMVWILGADLLGLCVIVGLFF